MALADEIAQILYGGLKPRNKSEWEARFVFWKKRVSDSEEVKIEIAKRQIKKALDSHPWLKNQPYKIIQQGSYHNNTNVRNDSDVDICVCHTGARYHWPAHGEVLPKIGGPLAFTFADFKAYVAQALINFFGKDSVVVGSKAIALHTKDENKVNADVVPAFCQTLYETKAFWVNGVPKGRAQGIGFDTDDGKRIYNYPEQHYDNGVEKNVATQRRYKKVVRILKRLRNHMKDNGIVEATKIPSYLIESMVFNCPNTDFESDSLYLNVREVLLTLMVAFDPKNNGYQGYTEVNGIKLLFHEVQPWTKEQASNFATAAYAYIGYN